MEDFKKLPKMQCFKEGGSVRNPMKTGGHAEAEEMKKDIAQDKAIVKKAFKMHDKQEHEGEHTDLSKLKKGGRMKKEGGCVGRYKAGGEVVNVYEAKKKSGDKDAIKKVKQIKPTKAAAPSKAAVLPAAEGTTNVMKKGGAAKKYAEGGPIVTDEERARMPAGKLPQQIVDEEATKENTETREMVAGPLRKLKQNLLETFKSKTKTPMKKGGKACD